MKKLCLLLVVFIIFGLQNAKAQNTYEGNVTLSSQAQVDAFVSGNYSVVNGFLKVSNGIDITDLTGLNSITSVSGRFTLDNCPQIINLDFISNLETAGQIVLVNNNTLQDVSGLSNLLSNIDLLHISNNNALVNLNGMFGTTLQLGGLTIKDNEVLENIDGLSVVEGSVTGEVSIEENNSLLNLDGLSGITEITGSLRLYLNPELQNILGLHNLIQIGDQLYFNRNHSVQSLDGLNSLLNIGSHCLIQINDLLTDLQGLNSLHTVEGSLSIQQNQNLTTLEGLDSLSMIYQTLSVISNPSLENFHGLQNLEYVGQDLTVTGNHELVDISSLGNIETIGRLNFQHNFALTSLEGLNGLNNIGVLFIHNNTALENIDALSGITEMSYGPFPSNHRDISITNNTSLTNVNGLSNLLSITGDDIIVQNNSVLDNLCGFSTMFNNNGFTGTFDISDNAYNPSMQDIIDGDCAFQIPVIEITYPKAGDHYIEGRSLRLQITSNVELTLNHEFDIEYSTDAGLSWFSGGNFFKDDFNGGFWLIPSVVEPTEFLIRLKTILLGNQIEKISHPFIVQPIDYYQNEGFRNSSVSEIEFTLKGGLDKWEQRFESEVHNCLDDKAEDWYRKGGFFASCGKKIDSPIDGIIIALESDYFGISNCGLNLDGSYGKQVVIQSLVDKTFAIRFAHLKRVKPSLRVGDTIYKNERIGKIGGTGTDQPHLHASLYKNIYEWINPYIDEGTGESLSTTIEILNNLGSITNTDGDMELCERLATNYSADFEFISSEQNGNFITESNHKGLNSTEDNLVEIYPNPVNTEIVNIENDSGIEIVLLEVFNLSGEKIIEMRNSSLKYFPVEGLNSGLFLVKIYFANGDTHTKKLIIKK